MTDAEINEAVARALGWEFVGPCNEDECPGVWKTPLGAVHLAGYYGPAQSLDACFRDLVPEAQARGLSLSMLDDHEIHPPQCFMMTFANTWGGVCGMAKDASPSRALCLAWLKTKGELHEPCNPV